MSTATPHPGMGAIVYGTGVAFRVWAPNAEAVFLTGGFNDWSEDAAPMSREADGNWYCEVPEAKPGDEYRFLIHSGGTVLSRIDPYARAVTTSVGIGIVVDPAHDWHGADFRMAARNEVVIYEMHVGTFHRPDEETAGTFTDAIEKLGHLKRLGVNAVQIMPAMEFAGDVSWGYNPAHIFAIESAYGGPEGFKAFIEAAHRAGSRSSLTSSTTISARATSTSGISTAGARTTEGGIQISTTTGVATPPGGHPSRLRT